MGDLFNFEDVFTWDESIVAFVANRKVEKGEEFAVHIIDIEKMRMNNINIQKKQRQVMFDKEHIDNIKTVNIKTPCQCVSCSCVDEMDVGHVEEDD